MIDKTMRLIDANALIKNLSYLWNVHDDDDFANKDVWREIENAPTIEPERKTVKAELNPLAEDIVIGNTTFKIGTRVIAECECGTWLRLGYKYCPNCGAKIDWGEE